MPPQVGRAGEGPAPISNQGVEEVKSKTVEKKSAEAPKDVPKNDVVLHHETAKDASTKKSDLTARGDSQKTALANQLNETVIKGTSGDDKIHVSKAKGKYELEVDVNGSKRLLTKEEAKNLVIDAGKGNDVVVIDSNVNQKIKVKGGLGNDVIIGPDRDSIEGGMGNDRIYDRSSRAITENPSDRIYGGDVDINGEKVSE